MLVGLFVGGKSRRMGGNPKGWVRTNGGEALIERLVRVSRAALPDAQLALVGQRPGYGVLGLLEIPDRPADIGPLGGLGGLLHHAQAEGHPEVLALACDLPYIDATLISELARVAPDAAAVAPLNSERGQLEPLATRYRTDICLPILEELVGSGARSGPRHLLQRLGNQVHALDVDSLQALADWDTPGDVERGGGSV